MTVLIFTVKLKLVFFFLSPILETQLSHRAQVAIAALSGGWFDDKFKNVHSRVQSLILIIGSFELESSGSEGEKHITAQPSGQRERALDRIFFS